MIHISQGYEKGIGLEVLFKSLLRFTQAQVDQLMLYSFKESAKQTLKSLSYDFKINDTDLIFENIKLKVCWLNKNSDSESHDSLKAIIDVIPDNDILFTLPTIKKALYSIHTGQVVSGHTEFFRDFYHNKSLGMFFSADDLNILLLTDHIPLSEVSSTLTTDYIVNKVHTSLNSLAGQNISEVIFAGINPHAGENGLLGNEDQEIHKAIESLKEKWNAIDFKGPLSADTLLINGFNTKQLFVYAYHDQGLAPFKSLFQFKGLHLTLGLPFLRISVDHGTAENLYLKNSADASGCYYCLQKCFSYIRKHEEN